MEKKKPRRLQQYRLRMSDAEAERLKQLSGETGMSCADVLRDALDQYKGIGGYGLGEKGVRDE